MKRQDKSLIQNKLLEQLEKLILEQNLEYNRLNVDQILKGLNWKARALVDYRNNILND